MKTYNLLLITLCSINVLYSQNIISRADIAHEELSREQLSVAGTILKAIELDKFELVHSFKNKNLDKDDNRLISNLIEKHNININGYPPLINDSKENLEGQYSRVYYQSGNNKRKLLFIVNIFFKGKSFKANSIELININEEIEFDSFLKHINKIVCGNRPVGPPAVGNLIDFKSGKEKRFIKGLTFRKGDLNIVSKIHSYKGYDLYLTFNGLPRVFFDTTSIWDLNIVSLKINERNGELNALTSKIGKLQHLEKLELNLRNTKVPTEIFDLKKLKELKIFSDYKIDLAITLQDLHQLKNLKVLSIYNDINIFLQEIFLLKNLEKLSIVTNSLASIPKEIGELKNLTELVISGSYIEVPHEIGKLENLRSLNFGSRELKSLPKSIGNLYNLSALWILKTVNLDSLPQEIGHIKNIEAIYFNDVEKLPKLKEPISNVSNIHISFSKDLSGINQYLEGTWKLNILGCSIDTLSNVFDYAINLAELTIIDCNNLKHIKKSTNNPQKLRSVRIENTGLEEIPLEILLSTKLKYLIFERSKLKEIPLEIANFTNLRELRLAGNLIKEIPIELLKLKNCKKIDLNNNNITEIAKEIANFEFNRKLEIYLYENPINPALKLNESIFKYKYKF